MHAIVGRHYNLRSRWQRTQRFRLVGRPTGSYPETVLWEVPTNSQLSTTRKYGRPETMNPNSFCFSQARSWLRFGLCARSVLNLHDRIQGSQVAARLDCRSANRSGEAANLLRSVSRSCASRTDPRRDLPIHGILIEEDAAASR